MFANIKVTHGIHARNLWSEESLRNERIYKLMQEEEIVLFCCLRLFKWIVKPFGCWSYGAYEWAFSNDMQLVSDLSQLARFNWLVDLALRPLNTFVHGNDWKRRTVRWLQSSTIDGVADAEWFKPMSVSSESVDFDGVRKKYLAGGDGDAAGGAADCENRIGVEVDDGGSGGSGGGGVCSTGVIGFEHTQRNFSLSHVGHSNLLNCNWIFC